MRISARIASSACSDRIHFLKQSVSFPECPQKGEFKNSADGRPYFPDARIVATLWQQLSWSHFRELLPLEVPLKRDYYMDLLFYHRKLRRLVVIDLKIGKFQAADKGQMELYLHWLEENEMQPGEEPPLGLVLCAGKTEGHVRLLRLEESGIHAAQYLTELLPRELLEKKLHDAIRLARERLARQAQEQPRPPSLPAAEKPAADKAKKRKANQENDA